MNYGSYLATGGVLASIRRMDVIANNLANANTTGFKPDIVTAEERPAERVEGLSPLADPMAPPQAMLEKLGGGIRFGRDRIDLTQGPLERTGSDSDVALSGPGFFVLAPAKGGRPDPRAGSDLTRDGKLAMDTDGTLRVASNGRALLGEGSRPIVLDPELRFAIDNSGRIFQDGSEVARMRIVQPRDPGSLEKQAGNILNTKGPVDRVTEATTKVAQGMLEGSGADPVVSMVELIRQSRLMEANLKMMQYQDNLTGQAITGITRIA